MKTYKEILTEAADTYFYSTDNSTINGPLGLADAVTAAKADLNLMRGKLTTDTFTVMDLKKGVSKELMLWQGKKNGKFKIGQNLTKADLNKKSDRFGSLI
jgi:hypothetical protein